MYKRKNKTKDKNTKDVLQKKSKFVNTKEFKNT
jgi:hypothetical protein